MINIKVGYIRVSSLDQNTARQEAMMNENVERLFVDKASGKNMERPQLKEMLGFVRKGDVLIVESISRLARNTRDHEFVREENNEYNILQKCDLLIIDDFASEKIQIAQTAESLQWLLRQRTIDHMNVKGNKPRCTILLCQYPRCEWSTQIVNENLKADYLSALIENHGIEMFINFNKKETFSKSWF